MAHFIPSAGVHRKGSSNSTTTAFCAPLKEKRRWAPGRLVAEPRGSGSADARATAALELLLAATIGGTALRRNPLRSFAGKVLLAAIHIGVSASSDTGSKIFTTCTEAFGWHHSRRRLPVADVERRTRFKWMQILAVRVGLAYLVRLPRLRAIPATSALRVSSPSESNRRTHHRLSRPAAVGSLLQTLIARIRKENANTAVLVTAHGTARLCRSGGVGLIPSPGR